MAPKIANMIRPVRLDLRSPFLESTCALCKASFTLADTLVVCPEDGALHHVHCWQANENQCSAYGCTGAGEIGRPRRLSRPPRARVINVDAPRPPRSKVRTMPSTSSNFGCARTCFIISILLAVLFLALGCFAIWAIVETLNSGSSSAGAALSFICNSQIIF